MTTMKTIYLITTGGTIEKEYSEQLGIVTNRGARVSDYLRRLRLPGTDVHLVQLMNKDSLEITPEDRSKLVMVIEQLLPLGFPIVVTHGTDTLVESGMLLQREILHLAVPVILTGAMKPLGFDSSDGLQNLTESLLAARLLGPGVFVVFHGQVFPIDQARKDRELGTFIHAGPENQLAQA